MNTKLLTEIGRLKQLMDLKILNEDILPKSLIDDLAKKIESIVGSKWKFISKEFENNVNKLKKYSTDTKTLTDDELATVIGNLIDESDEVSNYFIPKILNSLPDQVKLSIDKLKNSLKDYSKKPLATLDKAKKSIEDTLNNPQIAQFSSNKLKSIIKKDLNDFVENEFRVSTKIDPSVVKKTENFIKYKPEQIPNHITTKEIKQLNRLNRGFFAKLQRIRQSVLDFFTSAEKITDDTIRLINSYDNLDANQKTDAFARIQENILTLTQKQKAIFKDIDNWIQKEIYPYNSKLANELRSTNNWRTAESVFDGTWLKKYKEDFKGYGDRRKAMLKQLNQVFNPFSWTIKKSKKFAGPESDSWVAIWKDKWSKIIGGEEFKEFRSDFWFGHTKSQKQLESIATAKGWPKALLEIPKEWIQFYASITAAIAAYEMITGLISDVFDIQGDYPIVSKEKNQNWDKLMKIHPELGDSSEIEGVYGGLTTFVKGIFTYLMNSAKPDLGMPPLSFKLLNLFNDLTKSIETRESVITIKEKLLNLIEELRFYKKDVGNKAEEVAQKAKKETEKVVNKIKGTPDPILEKFKKYLKDELKYEQSEVDKSKKITENKYQDAAGYIYNYNGTTFEIEEDALPQNP
jgi:hypothetical protein